MPNNCTVMVFAVYFSFVVFFFYFLNKINNTAGQKKYLRACSVTLGLRLVITYKYSITFGTLVVALIESGIYVHRT